MSVNAEDGEPERVTNKDKFVSRKKGKPSANEDRTNATHNFVVDYLLHLYATRQLHKLPKTYVPHFFRQDHGMQTHIKVMDKACVDCSALKFVKSFKPSYGEMITIRESTKKI